MGTLQTCILGAQQAPLFIPSPGRCHHVGNECGLWNAARLLRLQPLLNLLSLQSERSAPRHAARDGSNFNPPGSDNLGRRGEDACGRT